MIAKRDNDLAKLKERLEDVISKPFLILDTETSGLGKDDDIIEISIINKKREVVFDSLVKPLKKIPDFITDINGINNEMVADAPLFSQIYPNLRNILDNQLILIYNSQFDNKMLNSNCDKNNLPRFSYTSYCIMKEYAIFYGECSNNFNSYKYQKLDGGHRALSDCFATFDLVTKMKNELKI